VLTAEVAILKQEAKQFGESKNITSLSSINSSSSDFEGLLT